MPYRFNVHNQMHTYLENANMQKSYILERRRKFYDNLTASYNMQNKELDSLKMVTRNRFASLYDEWSEGNEKFNNPEKFHHNPIWNDGDSGFIWRWSP